MCIKIKSDSEYKLLEPKDADKILSEKDNYIYYLYGVPIKTSFRIFPIINYQRYNKYDNDDIFNGYIEILKKYILIILI